jgi:hypothetical protein
MEVKAFCGEVLVSAILYWSDVRKIIVSARRRWTEPGTVNPHGQKVIRSTGRRGSHRFALVYEMECTECGEVYGANSCDIHLRKCPTCQGGKEGEPLE